jgi:hypothetical protein
MVVGWNSTIVYSALYPVIKMDLFQKYEKHGKLSTETIR